MSQLQQSFEQLRNELVKQFPERSAVIDGSLCAVLAGEHVLFIGPPGTAKSALVRAIATAFGGSYWEKLLTKFTTTDEIFGAISLKALEQDKFTRVISGTLADCEFAFGDEIFKSSSSILNAILGILNERRYTNGGAPVQVPLVTMFGASNELPEGKELEALFDRFILRFEVNYLLRPTHLKAVLMSPEPTITTQLDMKALKAAQAEVAKVKVTDATCDALISIRDALKTEGIVASDRRWKKSLKLTQAAAWLQREGKTTPEDLTILTDSLWREPKERAKIAKIVGHLADPVATKATEIIDAAREASERVNALKSGDRKTYIAKCTEAVGEFDAQLQKLEKLAHSGGSRARTVIAEASAEITAMHEDMARAVSSGLGLRRAAGGK